ncbi:MAG: M28 family peptidase [Psychroserpens sp.]|nr:M28 family peptidase [Psychroserpens sp.]
MKRIITILLLCLISGLTSAQTFNQFYSDIVETVSESNLQSDLTTYANFGIKEVGTSNLTNAENWIVSRYQSLGYTDIELQPFTFASGTSNNIIITKTGTLYPNTFLIIDGHYDSINGPGANDNGSGTVAILELARLLKDVETEYSIKFIHFSGEEEGLIVSQYYVDNTVIPENMDIRLVFNIDGVGGVAGANNNTIVCERELSPPQYNNAASNSFTNSLATLMELYSNLNTEISYAYASDYIPFENNGEIITGLYEKNQTPYSHSSNDIISNMDMQYLFQVTKGALGAALEFSVAFETLGLEDALKNNISIFPNPGKSEFTVRFAEPLATPVDFKLMDLNGKIILEATITEQNHTITTENLYSGNYLAQLRQGNKRVIKKLIKE